MFARACTIWVWCLWHYTFIARIYFCRRALSHKSHNNILGDDSEIFLLTKYAAVYLLLGLLENNIILVSEHFRNINRYIYLIKTY